MATLTFDSKTYRHDEWGIALIDDKALRSPFGSGNDHDVVRPVESTEGELALFVDMSVSMR